MKTTFFTLITVILFCGIVSQSDAYNFHWEIDETPEGQESATIVEPIQVNILDEQVEISSHSASIWLMKRYSVHLGTEWSGAHAYKLLQTFESIPQEKNILYDKNPRVPISLWKLSDRHIQNDIEIEFQDGTKIVTIAADAFTYANPLLAEIEGLRGRYFSKRLHRAVVRFVTDGGTNRYAIKQILKKRYDVSIDVPDYTELTRHTTVEHAGRFTEFKNEELMALMSMLEEFPKGMLKTPGLKYLVRRLDGTPHPLYPGAAAVAWTSAGYIEFMESGFKDANAASIHKLILHEKAHFLWAHLFDEQLKKDWIELGGWYENPDDKDGWSTTKQTEFVSAYAHGVNPNEDMAESIGHYIIHPDKLRSRSPAKYEFIQNRVMHGNRYISKIREDLTFEVYNLYPDYIYPGRIIRIDTKVEGEPEEDKYITMVIEIHSESNLDTAHKVSMRLFNEKGTYSDVALTPIDSDGRYISEGHIFHVRFTVSRYAPNGHWVPEVIKLKDTNRNARYVSQNDFGWKLYIDNPLADCEPPEYVKNSMRISLSEETTNKGRPFQVVTAQWQIIEKSGIRHIYAHMNDENMETYSRNAGLVEYNPETNKATAKFIFPDYFQSGTYSLNFLSMQDIALNGKGVYFTDQNHGLRDGNIILDELPTTIDIQTANPDSTPPVLDLNQITIKAEPTRPEDPNGETKVDITFRVKDDISGYYFSVLSLRDPQGVTYPFYHVPDRDRLFDFSWSLGEHIYFIGDPTVYQTYHLTITLPVGSVPGTWGLENMRVHDRAENKLLVDFTEIVRFKVDDGTVYTKSDVNEDGEINILDLVLVAQAFEEFNDKADVNGDGTVNILDLVEVASQLGEEAAAAPSVHSPTADQIQGWLSEAMQANDGSNNFRRGIQVLQSLLLKLRPETTALLPNYPNPFNPETWIPYHLANTSNVQIIIYDTKGRVVRTLALGHQTAGYYTDRNRAAYWNGRNGLEESVASGVYFYQLKTDATSYLRKMVILK